MLHVAQVGETEGSAGWGSSFSEGWWLIVIILMLVKVFVFFFLFHISLASLAAPRERSPLVLAHSSVHPFARSYLRAFALAAGGLPSELCPPALSHPGLRSGVTSWEALLGPGHYSDLD